MVFVEMGMVGGVGRGRNPMLQHECGMEELMHKEKGENNFFLKKYSLRKVAMVLL